MSNLVKIFFKTNVQYWDSYLCICAVLYYLLVSWLKNELGWEFPTAADVIAGSALRSGKIDMSQSSEAFVD